MFPVYQNTASFSFHISHEVFHNLPKKKEMGRETFHYLYMLIVNKHVQYLFPKVQKAHLNNAKRTIAIVSVFDDRLQSLIGPEVEVEEYGC